MPLVVSDLDHKLSSFSNNAISITTSFDVSATFQLGSIAWFKMFQTCNYSSLKKTSYASAGDCLPGAFCFRSVRVWIRPYCSL